MNGTEHHFQAEKFLAWFYRQPPRTRIDAAFADWSMSKDFMPPDREAIAARVRHILAKEQL